MLPEGWSHYKLSEIVSPGRKISYGIVQPGAHSPDGVFLIRGRDYSFGWAAAEAFFRVAPKIDHPYRRSKVQPKDLLLTIVGAGTGNVAVVPAWLDGANITQTTARISVDHKRFDYRFIRALLESVIGQRLVYHFIKGGAQPGLNIGDVEIFLFAIPPLPEQRKIAEILSTWDRAIAAVEKLIANARGTRSGMIAALLENEDWPLRQIGSFGDVSSAGVDKKSSDDEQPVRLLNYTDVFKRDFIRSADLHHWVTATARQLANCDVRRGDIFFTPSSETPDDIAHSAVAAEDIAEAAYSYHVVRLRLQEPWDDDFRAYAFKSAEFYRQAQALCAGSGQRYVLSQRHFRQIAIRVPPIEMQRKIGAVLKAIDDERNLLIEILTKLTSEKSALMQQLLTGKRRVTISAPATTFEEAAP